MSCSRELSGAAPSPSQTLVAALLRGALTALVKPAFNPRRGVVFQRRWLSAAARVTLPARGVPRRRAHFAGVPVELVGDGRAGCVLYLHGGGYLSGSPATHRALTTHLARRSDTTVVVADYRRAPEHPCPAALDDALAVYRRLLDNDHAPGRLALAGDSAGGGLALALLQRINNEGLPAPASAILISPWLDLSLRQTPAWVPGEAMLNLHWLEKAAEAYAGGQRDQAGASPLFGDCDNLPPLLIQSGGDEILRGDSERLADALAGTRTRARYQLYPDRWHVFQLHAGVLADADHAIDEMRDFLNHHWQA